MLWLKNQRVWWVVALAVMAIAAAYHFWVRRRAAATFLITKIEKVMLQPAVSVKAKNFISAAL
jgi:LPS O-antigen subunit length determinant protein (WzzB/FepE family)